MIWLLLEIYGSIQFQIFLLAENFTVKHKILNPSSFLLSMFPDF